MTSLPTAGTGPAPRSFAAPWRARGYLTNLDGPVHWVEFGAAACSGTAPPVVFVHGLGGSHLNWALIGPALAAGRRAVALDLHGFGLTPGNRSTATVWSNALLLDRFVREVAGAPVVLVGNSMGGLISILHAHAHPETVAGVVLIAPALPPPMRRPDLRVASQFLLYAMPGLGELYLTAMLSRMPPAVTVQRVVNLCFADPSRASPEMLRASAALVAERRSMPHREEAFLAAARSLTRLIAQRQRYQAMMAGIPAPVLLIGGEADRLVPVASVRAAGSRNPAWDTVILRGAGHTPQLEVPDAVATAIADWLARCVPPAGR